MAELAVGQKVWYVPHEDHWNDVDHQRTPLFVFAHHKDSQAGPGEHPKSVKPGAAVVNHQNADKHGPFMRDHSQPGVVLRTGKGHVLQMVRPRRFWQAEIVRVNADGSADLLILHPNGCELHEKPDRPAMKAFADEIRARLSQEEELFTKNQDAVAAPSSLREQFHGKPALAYEVDGQPATREEWRAAMESLITDHEDLTAHPGIKHDPKKGLHTLHLEGE